VKYAVISCSLNPASKSRVLAKAAADEFEKSGSVADFVDLSEIALPMCDGGAAYGDANVIALKERLREVDGFVVGTPIYNFDANAAGKNMIEMMGRDVWTEKVVGFLCAAGGGSSYMSIMAMASSLMLDFRTVVVPRFVYATGTDFGEDGVIQAEAVAERVSELTREVIRFAVGLRGG